MKRFYILALICSCISFAGCGFSPAGVSDCTQAADCPDGHICSGNFCYPISKIAPENPGGIEKTVLDGGEHQAEKNEPPGEMNQPDEAIPEADQPETPKDEPVDPCTKFTNLGDTCRVAKATGPCAEGTLKCVNDQILCAPNNKPIAEVCDGIDNDCNGQVDDGFGKTTCGTGECTQTVDVCVNGKMHACTPKPPATETCNMLDDDCDGTIDNGVPNCCEHGMNRSCGSDVGACRKGIQTCNAGAWTACTGDTKPSAEVCDGSDNDCNGQVDDGLGQITCGTGACSNTVKKCMNGRIQACTPKQASSEVCDGKDNDCDGQVDEGIPALQCGKGPCKVTTAACVNGQAQTCTPDTSKAQTETCNGMDDDCDGTIDNVAAGILTSDINNCGACGNVCPTPLNASPTCSAGKCEYTCKGNWRDLDGVGGCETMRSASVNDPNLVLHFDCESFSGAQLLDKSGKGNHGAVTGATISQSKGLFGNACHFDGFGKKIEVTKTTSMSQGKTISIWTKPTRFNSRETALWWSDDSPAITFQFGKWSHIFNQDGTASNLGPAPTSKWTHHLIVYGANKACSYIDASPIGCQPNVTTGNTLIIGGDPGTSKTFPDRYFRGYIDEVLVSSSEWSKAKINQYYEQTRP